MADKWIDRGDGVLHLIDASGSVIATQKPPKGGTRRVQDKRNTFMLDKKGRRVWVPKGTDMDEAEYPPSEQTWKYVCQLIADGKTLAKIGEMPEMPPARVLVYWMHGDEEQALLFRKMYDAAKRCRAETQADKVRAIADQETIEEKDVPGERLRKDILQWGAEMDDRETFGKQTKVLGNSGPTVILINTGVPEPQEIEVKSEVESG